jgi:hypothetical protein
VVPKVRLQVISLFNFVLNESKERFVIHLLFKNLKLSKMRVFGKKTPCSLKPPTQEMLDVGLAAAMRSRNTRVLERTKNTRVLEKTNDNQSIQVFEEASDHMQPENPLKSTSIDEFIANFRESASEFLSSAYL